MEKSEEEYVRLYTEMANLCQQEGWGDPFSYARSKEIYLSIILKHKISDTLSGADGVDSDGECEYKSTTQSKIQATYSGISVHTTWKDQERYLKNEKIGKYSNHYHARFNGSSLEEVWKLSGRVVLDLLTPKLKKGYLNASKKKDPRLSAIITEKQIVENGKRII